MSGGQNVNNQYLDSTELYDPQGRSWELVAAKLPLGIMGLRATNIDERLLFFGKSQNLHPLTLVLVLLALFFF